MIVHQRQMFRGTEPGRFPADVSCHANGSVVNWSTANTATAGLLERGPATLRFRGLERAQRISRQRELVADGNSMERNVAARPIVLRRRGEDVEFARADGCAPIRALRCRFGDGYVERSASVDLFFEKAGDIRW